MSIKRRIISHSCMQRWGAHDTEESNSPFQGDRKGPNTHPQKTPNVRLTLTRYIESVYLTALLDTTYCSAAGGPPTTAAAALPASNILKWFRFKNVHVDLKGYSQLLYFWHIHGLPPNVLQIWFPPLGPASMWRRGHPLICLMKWPLHLGGNWMKRLPHMCMALSIHSYGSYGYHQVCLLNCIPNSHRSKWGELRLCVDIYPNNRQKAARHSNGLGCS